MAGWRPPIFGPPTALSGHPTVVVAVDLDDDDAAIPQSGTQITYVATAAKVADALTQDVLLAPIESSVIPLPHQIRALSRAISSDRIRLSLSRRGWAREDHRSGLDHAGAQTPWPGRTHPDHRTQGFDHAKRKASTVRGAHTP